MIKKIMMASVLLVSANGVAQAPDAYSTCIACHGQNAEGNPSMGGPALAGQNADYLIRQLEAFGKGWRGDDATTASMAPMAAMLSEAQREEVAQYLSEIPVETQEATISSHDDGYRYYQAQCGSCHGGQGQGNDALNAPRLAGLDKAYLRRQLSLYKEGKRGFAQDDRLGRQMAMMARVIPSAEAEAAIIDFISEL